MCGVLRRFNHAWGQIGVGSQSEWGREAGTEGSPSAVSVHVSLGDFMSVLLVLLLFQ